MTYVPTANLTPLYSFSQYTSGGGTAGLQTALNAQPGITTGQVQVFADAQVATNALVVFNDQQVFSVPLNNYVGYNLGAWTQYPAAKLAGGANSLFTTYP
jgi:hypothetical protein